MVVKGESRRDDIEACMRAPMPPLRGSFWLRIRGPQPDGMGLKRCRPYGASLSRIRGMFFLSSHNFKLERRLERA